MKTNLQNNIETIESNTRRNYFIYGKELKGCSQYATIFVK